MHKGKPTPHVRLLLIGWQKYLNNTWDVVGGAENYTYYLLMLSTRP